MSDVPQPTWTPSGGRRPTIAKSLAASALSAVAIAAFLVGLMGLLAATTLGGLLLAGVGFVGVGVAVARWCWRLYRGTPSISSQAAGMAPADARAFQADRVRGVWLTVAKFLTALVPVYLLIGLLLRDREAAIGAAAVVAICAGGVGLVPWLEARRTRP